MHVISEFAANEMCQWQISPHFVSKEVWLITSTIARECDFVGSRFKLMLLVDGLIDLLMQNINGR
ncbi:hypothetical protein DERF_014293 [Dermatophagoides farinae]|uniref:Uncharacterized protein n=1 Tax=Dermatophagoides farinae TaxID=6954 RepID=A0A922HLX3_DERFA|nr:hypothetical protein DERF_014293 [Dermatophagoides farinae]